MLRETFKSYGVDSFIDDVIQKYETDLAKEILFGEETEMYDISHSVRKYDFGQASTQTVVEYGIKMNFRKETVKFSQLQDGGEIAVDIKQLASQNLECPMESYEVTQLDDTYEVWITIPESYF